MEMDWFLLKKGDRIEGDDLVLEVKGLLPPIPSQNKVPTYKFHIRRKDSDEIVGEVSLRVGSNDVIDRFIGHIGYAVFKARRGRGYAARACLLLRDLVTRHGLRKVVITCNPENIASARTCEKLGAVLVGREVVPPDHELYAHGVREKLRYEWLVG
mgnify:CR=1 FL=1